MFKRSTTLLASLVIAIMLQAAALLVSVAPASANVLGGASHGLIAGGPENVQLAQHHHHHYRRHHHHGHHHHYRRHHHHYGHHHHVRRHHHHHRHHHHVRRHHHHY